MAEKSIEIIIADTQFLIIESLRYIFQKLPAYSVTAVISSKYELQKALKQQPVDLLIIDHAQIDFDSTCDYAEIKKEFPELNILVLTNSVSRTELMDMNSCGIRNIIFKTADEEELFEAIQAALKAKKYYSSEIMDMLFEASERKASAEDSGLLTVTEIEIVRLIADGLTTKDIAARKFISFHTVISHRKNIFRKLHVSSASELVMFAVRKGWIDNIEYFI